ncbi:MAG TPA: DUF11 domain-containing protein [Patescibacteria group bacterium]|nr:DUF11 domain-containing protein [Patescibacteria group bacterium]
MHITTALRGLVVGLAGLISTPALANLTVTPITWDVVGLDSNRPLTSGPNLFPVGARVCTDVAATNVVANLVWDNADTSFINTRPGSLSTLNFGNLLANGCVDAYFEIELTRSPAAFGQSRPYRITAVADATPLARSPVPRRIHIESLVSQNRNTTTSIRYGQQADESDWVVLGAGGTIGLAVGETYFIELNTSTSTAYEEVQSFLTLSNTIFQTLGVTTTYSNDLSANVPTPNPRLWGDGCVWDSDPASPNYLSCLADGKVGGNVETVYRIQIISGGGDAIGLEALIYDLSGGSYHYNTDFSESPGEMVAFDPSDSAFSKRFVPATISPGGISRLIFTITNPNPVALSGYSFIDNLPAGVQVAASPNASTTCGGIWAPTGGDTSLAFDMVLPDVIGADSSCLVMVDVTAAALGTYNNVSNNLFFNGEDTGNNATATLTVSNATPPVCTPGTEVARWSMDQVGLTAPPTPSSNLVSASATFLNAAGGPTNEIVAATGTGASGNAWQGSGWAAAGLPLTEATASYYQFSIDTSTLSGGPMSMSLRLNPTPNGDWAADADFVGRIFASVDGGASFVQIGATAGNSRGTFSTMTGNLSAAQMALAGPTTLFRVNFGGRKSNPASTLTDAKIQLDDVFFNGCVVSGAAPSPPELAKAFSPATIGVGQTSALSFTVTNPNAASTLSQINFVDNLPPGVVVATPVVTTGTTCPATWAPTAGDSVLSYSSGVNTLAAGASCVLRVNVTSSSIGTHVNISDPIGSLESGTNTTPTGVASANLKVLASPTIEKIFDPTLVLLGVTPLNRSLLTLAVTNPNPYDAISGVTFTDDLPGSLLVNAIVALSDPDCGAATWTALDANSVRLSGATIPAAGVCTVSVHVTGPVGVYDNTTTAVTHNVGGVDVGTDTASDTLEIDEPIPAIAIDKQIGFTPDVNGVWANYLPVEVGQQVYYRIVIENIGETVLDTLVVSDPNVSTASCVWPASLPVADILAPTAHIATCVIGPITVSAAGTLVNTATVSAEDPLNNPVSDDDSATYATASMSLVKSATPTGYLLAGEVISYTFTVTNDGLAILPGPITIDDDKTTDEACPALTTIGDFDSFFDPGEVLVCTATYTITATDLSNGSVTNIAFASNGTIDSPTDTETVTRIQPDLSITKSDGGATATPGGTVAYTLAYNNGGGVAASGVVLTETVPANTTFNPGASTAGWVCVPTNNAGSTCTLLIGSVAAGAGGSAVFAVTVVSPVGSGVTQISNTATIADDGSFGPDPTPADNTGSDTTPLNAAPDLTVSKDDGGASVMPGGTVSYTLNYGNVGNQDATGVVLTETVPANSTFNLGASTAGWTCIPNNTAGSVCSLNIGTLAAGASGSATFAVTVDTPVAVGVVQISNTASIADDGGNGVDPTPGDNTDSDVTPVNAPQLTLTKTASASPWTVGVAASYTLQVSNTGTAATTAASTITDTIPAGLTLGTLPAGCTAAGQAVTCVVPAGLAVGGSTSFVIPVTPTLAAAPSVTNTATVSGGGDPTCPADARCSDTEGPTPVNAPVLTTTKTGVLDNTVVAPNDQSNPGDTIAYTITVTNSGNGPATNVVVTDPLVALTCTPISGSTLAAGATMTCTGTYTLVIGDVNTGSVTNTATVAGDNVCNPTTAGSTCSSTEVTPLGLVPILNITKSASPNPFVVGQNASYVITVTNTGNASTNANLVVTDTLPTGIGYVSAVGTNWSCAGAPALTCTYTGVLAPSASTVLTLNVSIGASAVNGNNTANVTGGGDPQCVGAPLPDRCDDTVMVPINRPDLIVTKSHQGTFVRGQPGGVYTLIVTNIGTAATGGMISVVDQLPAGLTATSIGGSGWSCVLATLTCTRSDVLAANASFPVITIDVSVDVNAPETLLNLVEVSGGNDDNPTNNTDDDPVTVTNAAPEPPTVPVPVDARWALLLMMLAVFALAARSMRPVR